MQLLCIAARSEKAGTDFGLWFLARATKTEVYATTMLKRERQKKLLSLIRAKRIATQEELRVHLERVGVPATQSSVSRDLEELGVIKHHGAYALPHANGDSARG